MHHPAWVRERGITVLEVLVALGVIVVLLSFAAPSLSGATAKAELKAATENLDFSIRAARNTARQFNTPVIMHLHNDRKAKFHSLSYSLPSRPETAGAESLLQTYEFPTGIRIVAEEQDIRFDFRGVVQAPVQVMLVSNLDDDIQQRVLVQ